MTGPAVSPPMDWNQWFGNSAQHKQELDAAMSRVNEYYNQFAAQMNPQSAMQVPVRPSIPAHAAWEDEDLVGAAGFWGLPEQAARQLPKDMLVGYVNQQRANAREGGKNILAMALAPVAQYGVGAAEAITGTMQRLPLVGDWLAKGGIVHDADMKLRSLEEGIRASTPQGEQGIESVANIAGNMTAMFYPGTAAWSLAGKLGEVVPLMSRATPLGRAALQGGLSAYLLAGGTRDASAETGDSGTQDPWTHRAEVIGGGAILGVAFKAAEPYFAKAASRVAKFFVSKDIGGESPPPPAAPPVASLDGIPAQVPAFPGNEFDATAPPNDIMHLRSLAANGDEQAQAILHYIGGGQSMEIPNVSRPGSVIGYHGTNQSFDTFNTPAFFALDQEGAAGYAQQRGGSDGTGIVKSAEINLQNPAPSSVVNEVGKNLFGYDDPTGNDYLSDPNPDNQAKLFGELTARGHDGAYLTDVNPVTGAPIRAMVVFNKDRIGPVAAAIQSEHAEALAVQMNQAGTIVQSPVFPEISAQTQIDQTSVGRAVIASNPGGTSVVQGITDPPAMAASLGQNARFAVRNGRLDVITGEQPLPDHAAWEYETFGMYTGQRVYTSDGVGGTIRGLDLEGSAYIEPHFSGTLMRRDLNTVHPWLVSPEVQPAPHLWTEFTGYADQRAAETQAALGGSLTPGNMQTIKTKNMALWMEGYLDDRGISSPGDRDRVRQYFNLRYVDSFKDAAPGEVALQQAATSHLNAAINETPLQPVQQLDQHASTKGFVAVPEPGGKWTLRDMATETTGQQARQISFGSREAAETWLKQINRELPDITPASDVPIELAAVHPTETMQPPNLNEGHIPHTLAAVREMESGAAEPPAGLPPEVHAAEGNLGELRSRYESGFRWASPIRSIMGKFDEIMFQDGRDYGLARDWENLSTKQNLYHTDMAPYQAELANLLAPVKLARKLSGEWAQVYETLDPVKRAEMVRDLKWSPAEIESLDRYDGLMQKLFPETSLEEIRQIPQYFSHIARRQSVPETFPKAFEDFHLGPTTQPFYEFARTGNLNFRELDPSVVGDSYIRSVMWQKHMAEDYNGVLEKWTDLVKHDPRIAEGANFMNSWLKVLKDGYHPQDDFVLNAAHDALKLLVDPSITRGQAREVVLGGLNATYSGMIGFRPNMISRHFLQMTYAIPRVGMDLVSTLGQFAKSGAARRGILDEAIADGAITPRSFTMNAPGAFTGEMERVGADIPALGADGTPLTPEHTARYKMIAKLRNAVYDAAPDVLKGQGDSLWKPMGAFAQAVERFRAIVYVAGKQRVTRALGEFRAAGEAGDLEKLMGDSMARTFDPAWQREFQQRVATGAENDGQTAAFLARQLTDATFFKYGSAQSPWIAKSVTGKVAIQMSHYSLNYLNFLGESLRNGTPADKVKLLATFGATTAGLNAASRKTGWNLNWLNPWFAGAVELGPTIGLAVAAGSAVRNAITAVRDGDQAASDKVGTAMKTVGSDLSAFSPAGGVVKTVGAVEGIANSPSPFMTATDYLLTGHVGSEPEQNAAMYPQAEAAFRASLQPYSSPVRAGGTGLPAGYAPAQPAIDPPLIQDPRAIPPSGPGSAPSAGLGTSTGTIQPVDTIYPNYRRR